MKTVLHGSISVSKQKYIRNRLWDFEIFLGQIETSFGIKIFLQLMSTSLQIFEGFPEQLFFMTAEVDAVDLP